MKNSYTILEKVTEGIPKFLLIQWVQVFATLTPNLIGEYFTAEEARKVAIERIRLDET